MTEMLKTTSDNLPGSVSAISSMSPAGRHLLVEYSGCDARSLSDLVHVKALLLRAASCANVVVLDSKFHKFELAGLTGVLILSESHISIHTWPEHGYAAVDFYTCGAGLPEIAEEVVRAGLHATITKRVLVRRGTELTVTFLD